MSEDSGSDVNLEIGGQKVAVRNVKSLNTLATVAALVIIVLVAYALYEHRLEAKADGLALAKRDDNIVLAIKEFTAAQKEASQVARVTNCLISLETKDRAQMARECERISR